MIKRAIALISLAAPAVASDFSLQLPIDCTLGENCYIQQFVDHDPNASASDFACGPLTYDTHKGTDFALDDLSIMKAGVDVLAAAAGRVVATRDGMEDLLYTAERAAEIDGRDCGNGLVIDHGSGWRTQYCHLKQGSVVVERGQIVEAGAVLGEVGLSGRTQFPHLHMTLRKNDQVVDPFAPEGRRICDLPKDTLWAETPVFQNGGIIRAGFADAAPTYEAIKAGQPSVTDFTPQSDILAVWMHSFGAQEGDNYRMEITGPDGEIVQEEVTQKRTQAQSFRFVGKRRPPDGWASGLYTATLSLIRDGVTIDTTQIAATVE
ncbi:M23 family metallopeptidase [Cognatishimia sp. MH4019]|uniref:M23 family metallopeptidase n=1 Tax=Cognatishimia sp. MH4019 TaxID=2854030 RepID=UPI001CD2AFF6|nr:M23 family metallopeptidase [Cognatishimia sp. MH4019]